MTTIDTRALRSALSRYQQPSAGRSLWELLVTAAPLAALWAAIYLCMDRGWWWGLALAVPAAGLLVRLFMIQHDCGHHAFFRSVAANTWVGRVSGVFTLTPYEYWRRTHAIHHATSGNLDRRSLGGIETLTVEEYQALPRLKRLGYRLYRNPLVILGLGPTYMFLLQHRLPIGLMKEGWAWASVLGVNLGLVLFALPFVLFGNPVAMLLTHVPIMILAATAGVLLFYVQHQFEDTYWARRDDWNVAEAALRGSSHLVLPAPLQWLTANIGVHHVHHAASRIPFYRLPEVLRREPVFQSAPRVGLPQAIASLRLALWDERQAKLVPFR